MYFRCIFSLGICISLCVRLPQIRRLFSRSHTQPPSKVQQAIPFTHNHRRLMVICLAFNYIFIIIARHALIDDKRHRSTDQIQSIFKLFVCLLVVKTNCSWSEVIVRPRNCTYKRGISIEYFSETWCLPNLIVMLRSNSFLKRTVCTPEIAFTTVDLPWATWPIVPTLMVAWRDITSGVLGVNLDTSWKLTKTH